MMACLRLPILNRMGRLIGCGYISVDGPIFSDRILLSRAAFIEQLKAGKRYMVGERIDNMGGKFNVTKPVHVQQKDGNPVIVVGDAQATQDELAGVPII